MADVEYSFIITFHKEEQFLIHCLNALLPNIPKDAEVIIIGVGLDSSILNSHLRDNRIRLIELIEAIPFPEAINKASQRAKGEVLILLDQDVIPFNNWFQKILFPKMVIEIFEKQLLAQTLNQVFVKPKKLYH